MTVTGESIGRAAFEVLNTFQPGESIPGPDQASALGWLNRMLSAWRQQSLTVPSIARLVTPLVAGKGSPANPYRIGLGGDINVAKPARQDAVAAVGLLLNASVPPVEIPRGIFTNDGWQATQIKDLTNSLFTNLYYNPTVANGFGEINLWPVPDNALNSLVLYLQQALANFATWTTAYEVPDGVEEALVLNLARRLAKPYGSTVDVTTEAATALGVVKRANVQLADLPNDVVFHDQRGGLYNIQTGQ